MDERGRVERGAAFCRASAGLAFIREYSRLKSSSTRAGRAVPNAASSSAAGTAVHSCGVLLRKPVSVFLSRIVAPRCSLQEPTREAPMQFPASDACENTRPLVRRASAHPDSKGLHAALCAVHCRPAPQLFGRPGAHCTHNTLQAASIPLPTQCADVLGIVRPRRGTRSRSARRPARTRRDVGGWTHGKSETKTA